MIAPMRPATVLVFKGEGDEVDQFTHERLDFTEGKVAFEARAQFAADVIGPEQRGASSVQQRSNRDHNP